MRTTAKQTFRTEFSCPYLKTLFMRKTTTLLFLVLCSFMNAMAQCPLPAACTPGGPTDPNAGSFNMGIRRVILNNIDNSSSFVSSTNLVSYEDFSCTDSTELTVGVAYNVTVNTNGNPPLNTANENVRIWIDLNADSAFSSNELVFSSDNKQSHTGSLTVPPNAVFDSALRMRVAAEWISATNSTPTACGDREYSQVEDYKVVLLQNLSAPVADFDADPKESCDGVVQFTDLSTNGATSWLWDFGDTTFSIQRNPQKTYTRNDTFDVTLIAFNANGSDTITKSDFIVRTGLIPANPVCTPITNAYCCGYGITGFQFEDINNTSSDALVGYEDFSCTQYTEVVEGFSYNVSFTTSSANPEDIKMYIDINGNGSFEDAGELIYSASNVNSPTTSITIPAAQLPYETPLRMRIMSDAIGTTFNSCTNLVRGQAEDYTVLIGPNPLPPLASFTEDQANACQKTIQFTDQSLNAPRSWFWDFGDGNTDTVQNPLYTYTSNGTYTVKLVVTNNNGVDSANTTITVSDGAAAPNCVPGTDFTFFPLGIERVVFNTINNTTSSQPNFPPYEDFACDFTTTVTQGQNYLLTVETQSDFTTSDVRAWLDYNNNGTFESSELIMSSDTQIIHNQLINISTGTNVVTGAPLRLRIASDFVNAINGPVSCGNLEFGQTEDYTVIVTAPQVAPDADFTTPSFISCNGTFNFTDLSGFAPDTWSWDFGDGGSSSAQNPSHTYTAVGAYFVELIACNSFGCDTVMKTVSVTKLDGTKPALCVPGATAVNPLIGIFNVTLNNLNVSTTSDVDYTDFSCDKFTELVESNAYTMEVQVGGFNNHTIEAWIDFNNNGNFTSNEKILSTSGSSVVSDIITIPANAVLNEFLRMRVMTSTSNSAPFDPCVDLTNGEIEDYGVIIRSPNVAPIADFDVNAPVSCNGEVTFVNQSYYDANAYLWEFGDGNSSVDENPTHRYLSPGIYTVKLTVQNGFGSDSITKSNVVSVSNVQGPDPAICYPITQFSGPDFGIVGFDFESISNTNTIVDGYENYTCSDTAWVKSGTTYNLEVFTSTGVRANVRVLVDFNADGDFDDQDELAFFSNNTIENHQGIINIPSGAAKNIPLRLRIFSDLASVALPVNIGCGEPEYGQVEDYAIVIDGVSNINSEIANNNFNIYPNPSSGFMNLEFNSTIIEAKELIVYDQLGNKVYTSSLEIGEIQKRLDLSHLNAGIYFLNLYGSNGVNTQKIIIE